MILLVEDSLLDRQATAQLLSLSGYKVMGAADGQQAVELLNQHPFELVITDLALPKLSGFQLIGYIRLKWPMMPVLVVSGETNAAQTLHGKAEFFPKPLDPNAMLAAVKRLTQQPSRLRDHALLLNWPPSLTSFTNLGTDVVRREIGVLRQVRCNRLITNQCLLLIEHQGEFLIGALMFHEAKFCQQIAELLRHHIGRPIKDIGDLQLSRTL